MIDLVTDMIGKTVEVHRHHYDDAGIYLIARGALRAAYVADRGVTLVVEAMAGAATSDLEGEIVTALLIEHRVRVVEQCTKCLSWVHPSELEVIPEYGAESGVKQHSKVARNTCRNPQVAG